MNKAEEYNSPIFDKIFQKMDADEAQKIENKMLLAAKIDDGIKAKGWNRTTFAEKINKKASVITKWLSGTHNFTSDTLWDIERVLDIKLIYLEEKPSEQVIHFHFTVSQETGSNILTECDDFQYASKYSNLYYLPEVAKSVKTGNISSNYQS